MGTGNNQPIDWSQFGGTTTTARPPTSGPNYLSELQGRLFFDPRNNSIGFLTVYQPGRLDKRRYFLTDESGNRGAEVYQGTQLYDPVGNFLYNVAGPRRDAKNKRLPFNQFDYYAGESQPTETERKRLIGMLGLSEDGGGGAVSANTAAETASRESIAAAQRALDLQLEQMREQSSKELQQLQDQAALKRQGLSTAGSLTERALQVQQETRNAIAQLIGVDPVAASITGQGSLVRGTTPAQGFMNANRAFASQPLPSVSAESSQSDIDAAIRQLQGFQSGPTAGPGIQPGLGLAQGGTIDMQQGPDGMFAMAPRQPPQMPSQVPQAPTDQAGLGVQQGTTKRAVLVGEQGSPPVAPGTEVMVLDTANPGHTEVIPLVSGAQVGGDFDIDTARQQLAPLFRNLGFLRAPIAHNYGDPGGYILEAPGQGTSLTAAHMLGFRPELVRNLANGAIYWRNPSNQLQRIGNPAIFQQSGFHGQDVLNMSPEELQRYVGEVGGYGADLNVPVSQGYLGAGVRNYPTRPAPLITPQAYGSIPLPDPKQLAGIYRFLEPSTLINLYSVYGRAGLGTPDQARAALEQEVQYFTPHGTQRAAGTSRFG